jgi:predicted ATPase
MALAGEGLVGRADELGAIGDALDTLDEHRPVVLELIGEPGIGKTRLLAELAQRADARGHLVLTGSASELEVDVPFWVFVDALDEYVRSLDPRRVATLPGDVVAELAAVLPSLSAFAAPKDASVHERYRSHRAVRELLSLLAAEQPLVLILDDLHWGEPRSSCSRR